MKIKESEKEDKYLDLIREQRTLWNMKVTVFSIVVGIPGTFPQDLVRRLEELEIRDNSR